MSSIPDVDPAIRDHILSDPSLILDDRDLMRALVDANDRALGDNIIDLRGVAMERLKERLDRLEDTHRSVLAAAHETLAGISMIQRAVLELLEPEGLEDFLSALAGPLADTLRVASLRLLVETSESCDRGALDALDPVLGVAELGYCSLYAGQGRSGAPRVVTLRSLEAGCPEVHGDTAARIRSEACLLLDLGEGVPPGLLVLGAEDPQHFAAGQGTDLLHFFAHVFERVLRHRLP